MSRLFDRHPYLRSSNAEPYTPPANNLRTHVTEVITRLKELDNEQLAALYSAVEVEHVNRMAELAGVEA